jgi:hypothetical protein
MLHKTRDFFLTKTDAVELTVTLQEHPMPAA